MHRHHARLWIAGIVAACTLAGATPRTQDRNGNEIVRDARLRSARTTLGALLADSRSGVEGRIVERFPGSYVFAPRRFDLPQAPIVNNDRVGALAVGPRLRMWGQLDPIGRLKVDRYTLASVPPGSDSTSAGAAPVSDRPSTRLVKTLNAAVQPGTRGAGAEPDDQTRASLKEIRAAYQAAVQAGAGDATIRPIVERWANARLLVADVFPDSDDFKALYGPQDNYDPWRYDLIFRQSPSVVAIGEPGELTARCSGVLIAADLVLTAGHCFAGSQPRDPADLQIWFGYARSPSGASGAIDRRAIVELVAPAPAHLADIKAGAFSSQLLDYAIVRFATVDANGQPLPASAQAVPQCLRRRPLRRSDPVYVVGYPQGAPIMVHDSARIYLPYRIEDGDQYTQLRLDVEADLLGSPDRVDYMREFEASYETVAETPTQRFRYFHHVRDGGQPRMGIVADTFRGNSGGPVYDREGTQCVVGILIAGADDTGARLTPNWKQHERVLPVSAVLEDAERHAPGIVARLTMEPR